MRKLKNCWEVMKCGFGTNGDKTKANGVCPLHRKSFLMAYMTVSTVAGHVGLLVILLAAAKALRETSATNIPLA